MKLDEMKRLTEAATAGPWDFEYGVSQRTAWLLDSLCRHPETVPVLWLDGEKNFDLDVKTNQVEQDMDFIAMARTAMPRLLAVAAAAREAAERTDSSDAGWALDGVRDALAALEAEG